MKAIATKITLWQNPAVTPLELFRTRVRSLEDEFKGKLKSGGIKSMMPRASLTLGSAFGGGSRKNAAKSAKNEGAGAKKLEATKEAEAEGESDATKANAI